MSRRGWYIVHTQSSHEDKIRSTIENRIQGQGFADRVFKVMIPTEDVVEVKRNKKVVRKRKFFPGYVLLDMILENETYWFIKGIPGITGFLGEPNPVPLPQEEVSGILELTTSAAEGKPRPAVQFEKGESVRITEGPFRHFIGMVEEVNEPKAKLKAMVTIFGRPTPVQLDFLQVEKL